MTLDEARAANPHLGFAVYAYDPVGAVTLEIHAGAQVFTFIGLTEAEALTAAFPAPPPLVELAAPAPAEEDMFA